VTARGCARLRSRALGVDREMQNRRVMATLTIDRVLPTTGAPVEPAPLLAPDPVWRPLFRLGGVAAASLVAIIVVAVVVYLAWPPPAFEPRTINVVAWYELFERNPWLGLLELDGLMLIGSALSAVLFLALHAALRPVAPASMAIATTSAIVSAAVYFTANPAFSLLALSEQFAAATSSIQRAGLLVSGQALLAVYQGTPFDVSYVLSGIAGLIASTAMLRSRLFGTVAPYLGIGMGLLLLVPPTLGTIGVIFSFAALILQTAWSILVARHLFRMAREPRS
jgi:hypothetical protein